MPLTISGKLSLPVTGQPASNAQIRFRAVNAVGEVITGAESVARCDASGNYSITVEFCRYELSTKISTVDFVIHGVVNVDKDTQASDLEDLITLIGLGNDDVLTDELIRQFEQIKADAEQARDEAEAAAVEAKAAAAVFKPENDPANISWDVSIPFNEGGELERGYGSFDLNGNRSVTFTRASGTSSINKSGIVESLLTDKIAISSDGMESFNAYANIVLYSEDLSSSLWTKSNVSLSSDSTTAPDGTLTADNVGDNSTSTTGFFAQTQSGLTDDSLLKTASCFFKAGTSNYFQLEFRLSGGTTVTKSVFVDIFNKKITADNSDGSSITLLNDGWIRVEVKALNNSSGNTSGRLLVRPATSATALDNSLTGDLNVWGTMITDRTILTPYVKSESSSSTRSPDVTSIPSTGNLPMVGSSFSVICDAKIVDSGSYNYLLSGISNQAFFIAMWNDGLMRAGAVGASVAPFSPPAEGVMSRFCLVYDGDKFLMYIDGDLKSESSPSSISYDFSTYDISIGSRNGASQLDSVIKNFRILHGALSQDQVKAIGGSL